MDKATSYVTVIKKEISNKYGNEVYQLSIYYFLR